MKPGEEIRAGLERSEPENQDAEQMAGERLEKELLVKLGGLGGKSQGGVFGVQNQPSEATL